jgi:hypothetical protein
MKNDMAQWGVDSHLFGQLSGIKPRLHQRLIFPQLLDLTATSYAGQRLLLHPRL